MKDKIFEKYPEQTFCFINGLNSLKPAKKSWHYVAKNDPIENHGRS